MWCARRRKGHSAQVEIIDMLPEQLEDKFARRDDIEVRADHGIWVRVIGAKIELIRATYEETVIDRGPCPGLAVEQSHACCRSVGLEDKRVGGKAGGKNLLVRDVRLYTEAFLSRRRRRQ